MKKTLFVVSLFASLLMGAQVATFTVDAVKQRYPWNGLVDVDYTVTYADGEIALNPVSNRLESMATTGETSIPMAVFDLRTLGKDATAVIFR